MSLLNMVSHIGILMVKHTVIMDLFITYTQFACHILHSHSIFTVYLSKKEKRDTILEIAYTNYWNTAPSKLFIVCKLLCNMVMV